MQLTSRAATQARSGSPFSPAIKLSAAISAISLRLLTVALVAVVDRLPGLHAQVM
jgi:hypothetical protein